MTAAEKTIIAFDLYGTLLSTESIAQELAKQFGQEKSASIAATWRKYQLEYTWRLNSMVKRASPRTAPSKTKYTPAHFCLEQYLPFSSVTQRALTHALSEHAVPPPPEAAVASLMSAYDSLSTFPDVAPALESLAKSPSVTPVVFSNGTDEMVGNSVHRSPDLSPYSNVFRDFVTVEEVKKFKPHPDVYYHLAKKVGKSKGNMGDIWLVSGNPFDVIGAKAVGAKACWVDRGGHGWSDRLGEGDAGEPDFIGKDLGEIVQKILNTSEARQ
ncbi:MAG: hypothetical protein Q9180_006995 [Flavoplaca navasiana]